MPPNRDTLRRQLAEAEENLRLIEERKAEYVLASDIPLQLVKQERALRDRNEQLRVQLAALARWTIRAPVADFTGRGDEISALVNHLSGSGGSAAPQVAAISGLHGMGGVGKSELARVVSHRLRACYPDAGFEIELQPGRALTVAEVYAAVIHAAQPGWGKLPDEPAELHTVYCAALDGQRGVLLLDNAAGPEQVRPLLPPPAGWAVIVTSRSRFALPGGKRCDLDVLPVEQAVELLRRVLADGGRTTDDGRLTELAEACGRLPLALRVAGSYLAAYADWSVEEYLAELGKARLKMLNAPGEPSVAAVLALSLDRLDALLAERWHSLAVFPTAFDRAAAAAVWDVPEGEARGALSSLVQQSLVEYDDTTKTYSLHDLLAELAREMPVSDQLRFCHANYYLAQGRETSRLYEQGGAHVLESLRLFDAIWPHLLADWDALKARTDERALNWLNDMPDAVTYVLDLRVPPRTKIAFLEGALAAARGLHRRGEGAALGSLGQAYAALGETRRAIALYEQALEALREIGDRRGEGAALGNLGNAYADLGETRRAIELYEQQLVIVREIGDRRGEGSDLNNLGEAYLKLGELEQAAANYRTALANARELGLPYREASRAWSLGEVYEAMGLHADAAELMALCVAWEQETGHADYEKDAARLAEVREKAKGGVKEN